MRAGDSVNYSIGQGDTLVTPIQMATIYAAIANGGTLWNPTVGKAIISPDGKKVTEIEPKSHGRLPMDAKTQALIEGALAGVATRGTAAWRFGGWPQDKIPMHAKTGTAEVYGKQTTSWFATYTKDYAIIMTIAQGGTGSGASGPAVRNIYDAIYGLDDAGNQDLKRACCRSRRRPSRRSSPTAPSTRRRSSRTTPRSEDRPERAPEDPGPGRHAARPDTARPEPGRPDTAGPAGTRGPARRLAEGLTR